MNTDLLKRQLELHEARRLKPYADSVGKLTIGVGRNLDDRGISDAECDFLLANDIAIVVNEMDRNLPWWQQLDEVRQRVLADMCFNLGIQRLKGFAKALSAMREGRFEDAASEMQDSKWYAQVGTRGARLVRMMRTGRDE